MSVASESLLSACSRASSACVPDAVFDFVMLYFSYFILCYFFCTSLRLQHVSPARCPLCSTTREKHVQDGNIILQQMNELRLTLSLMCEEQVLHLFVISLVSRVLSETFSRPRTWVLPEAQQHSKVTPSWLFVDFQLSLFQAEWTKWVA